MQIILAGYNKRKGEKMIIELIQGLCGQRKIRWSTHGAARMQERGITRKDVINCLEKGAIIEDYPTDFPHPSCLIFGHTLDKRIIHVVAGCDKEYVYIITAYFPSLDKFEGDMKTRKER